MLMDNDYIIEGLPVCVPFTQMSDVEEAVRNTGVHMTKNANAQLAVSVFVRGFVGDIFAVWVFVASVENRDRLERGGSQRSINY